MADVDDGTASVIDLVTGTTTKSYVTGANPHCIDISNDAQWLFVSIKTEETLKRVNLKENIIETINIQPAPYHLEYVDEVKKLYVSSRKQPKIWVINPVTLTIIKTLEIGEGVAHQMVVHKG